MDLFGFNQPNCNKRMKMLMEEFKDLKKMKYNPTYNFYDNKYKAGLKNQNVYYWKRKNKSIEHDLLINRFYVNLLQQAKAEIDSSCEDGIVVFTPGATSFGMFNNEFDRGEKYKKAVEQIFLS